MECPAIHTASRKNPLHSQDLTVDVVWRIRAQPFAKAIDSPLADPSVTLTQALHFRAACSRKWGGSRGGVCLRIHPFGGGLKVHQK